ncbi:Cell wall surface anchor family protein [Lactococcus lactis subsp. lactis A12]|uniref:Cell wall surface anchor family protein n=1 Tax=Lactococcus lactis subsp. lactis A12 TaxID=1137134 RepID=S6F4L3_LACLL|nr:Cell wall surface anchor family protein [Lactococcus lactis subsp. lactis A12]SBW29603.1 Cell wall surface anchor family protein [Lactococcus lactis subsp. lactis]
MGWLAFNRSATSAASDNNRYLATQELIWDVTTGHGLPKDADSSAYGPGHMDMPGDEAWYEGTANYQASEMLSDMNELLQEYQTFTTLPDFGTSSQTVKIGEAATFKDAAQVLSNFGTISTTNGLKASVSGNTLIVLPTQAGTGTVTLSNGGISETDGTANSGGVHVWFTNNPDGATGQNLIFSNASPEEKVIVTVKALPSASLKIIKKDSATGKPIAGAIFEGLNKEGQVVTKGTDGQPLPNGGKFTTGSDGSVVVDNLMDDPDNQVNGEADTIVTLREVSVPRPYSLSNNLASVVDSAGNAKAPSTDLPITLVAGTTSTDPTGVTFSDKAQVQAIKVQKTATLNGKSISTFPNGNYSLEGAVFTIRDDTQKTTLGKLYTDAKGWADLSVLIKTGDAYQTAAQYQALLNQLLCGSDTYSIQETEAPNGLACDWNGGKPQTFQLSDSGDDTQLINPTVEETTHQNTDTPLTVSSTLTKVDADTKNGTPQGAGLLSGTIETLFYGVDVKDATGKVIHPSGTPVDWDDGFDAVPIEITSGKKVAGDSVTLQMGDDVNSVGVKNLPLTALSAQDGYYWAETDAKGKLTPGYGYTANTTHFEVASGEGADGTGPTLDSAVISGSDTNVRNLTMC